MCIVEQKTYYQADGSPRLYESIRRCSNAIGPGPCSNVTHTFANIVETRPDSSSRTTSSTRVESTSKADVVVTDSRGQTRVYRDLSRRSSQRTKPSRSRREDDRTSRERRQAAPSPVYDTARPSPISRTATPNSAPPMMSSFPPSLQPESTGSGRIAADGTAIYDSPASHLPRVPVVEHRPTTPTARKVSFKDTPTSPNEPDRSRHPNLSINTAREREPSPLRPSLSSPRRTSPGLSQLSSHHHARKDSARDLPSRDALRKDLNSPSNDSEYLTRQSAREESRRQTAQLRRQADLQAAEDRHLEREAAAAAAAASRLQPEPLLFPTQQRSSIDSDRSTWSRHTSPPRGAYFPSGEAEEQRQGQARRYAASTSPLAQPFTRRSRNQKTTYGVPTLHQDPIVTPGASTTRAIDPLSERGMEVVEERRRERRERDEHARNEKAYHDRKREGQTRGRYHEQQPKREERGYEAEGFDEVVRERERRTEGYYVSEGLGVAREAVRRKKRERGEGREGREFWD